MIKRGLDEDIKKKTFSNGLSILLQVRNAFQLTLRVARGAKYRNRSEEHDARMSTLSMLPGSIVVLLGAFS